MRKSFISLVIAGIAAAVRADDTDAAKADVEKMQGEWSMVSGSADGQAMPAEMLPQARRICKDNETTVTIGPQLILKAIFTVDPGKAPKTIDYKVTDGPTKGKTHLGIYEFEGDTIRFCFAAPDFIRPTTFTTAPGDRRALSVWKKSP